jgi:hypothetical protein
MPADRDAYRAGCACHHTGEMVEKQPANVMVDIIG